MEEQNVQNVQGEPSIPEATQSPTSDTPSTYKIGEKEYDAKTLQDTLSNYDKLQAEYTRKSQELAEIKRRDEEVQKLYTQEQPQTPSVDPAEATQYQEAAKLLAPYLKDALGLDTVVSQLLEQERSKEAMINKYKQDLSNVEEIAKKASINFSQDELVNYMKEKQIPDVEAAFRTKYFTDLVAYEARHQKSVEKKPYSEGGVSAKIETPSNKVTDPTDKAFRESLTEKVKAMFGG